MITATIQLTEEQRHQLLDILYRRFHKMTDLALLELERLTRHPVNLTGFQPKTNEVIATKASPVEVHKDNSEEVIDAVFTQPLSRREFLVYIVLGLISGGTTYGWIKRDQTADSLSATLGDVNLDINGLTEKIRVVEDIILTSNANIKEFQNSYQQTVYSLAQFKDGLNKTKNLYEQFGQVGRTITELIQFILNSYIPEKFVQPVNVVLDLLTNISDTINLADYVLANLNLWFSEEPSQGIDNKVLSPAQLVFNTLDNDIKASLINIQARIHFAKK